MIRKISIVLLGILLFGTLILSSCTGAVAKNGDTVSVNYTGTLQDGTLFDTSEGFEPLEFILGSGELIPGFEEAVIGMKVEDSKTVTISAENAYPYRPELVMVISRDQLPEGLQPAVGLPLQMTAPDGTSVPVVVTEVTETTVTVDANHPLAGEDLTFEIELVKIVNRG